MIHNKKSYSLLFIAKQLGLPRSNLQQYNDKHFIEASIEKADGKGSRNRFSIEDVYMILLFLDLHELGVPQAKAAKLCKKTMQEHKAAMYEGEYDWFFLVKEGNIYSLKYYYGPHFQEQLNKSKDRNIRAINLFRIKKTVDSLFS